MSEIVKNIVNEYPDTNREHLISILQSVQDKEGFLSRESITAVARRLKLPASKVFGVATFYNQFKFQKSGKHHIMVCRGTACHVKGSAEVLAELERELKITAGQTSRDGLFSIEVVACIGACGLAPVISINGEYFAGVKSGEAKKIIKKIKKQEKNNG